MTSVNYQDEIDPTRAMAQELIRDGFLAPDALEQPSPYTDVSPDTDVVTYRIPSDVAQKISPTTSGQTPNPSPELAPLPPEQIAALTKQTAVTPSREALPDFSKMDYDQLRDYALKHYNQDIGEPGNAAWNSAKNFASSLITTFPRQVRGLGTIQANIENIPEQDERDAKSESLKYFDAIDERSVAVDPNYTNDDKLFRAVADPVKLNPMKLSKDEISTIREYEQVANNPYMSPEEKENYKRAVRELYQGEIARNQDAINQNPAYDKTLYKIGEYGENKVNELIPISAADRERTSGIIGSAIGSLGAYVASSLIPVVGPSAAAAGGMGDISASQYDDAAQSGATEEQARRAAMYAAPVGLSEYLPASEILQIMKKSGVVHGVSAKIVNGLKIGDKAAWQWIGEKFPRLAEYSWNILKAAAEEAGQEGFENTWQNYVASDVVGYDKDRKITEGLWPSAFGGGAAGGAGGALATYIGRRGRRTHPNQPEPNAPEAENVGAPTPPSSNPPDISESPIVSRDELSESDNAEFDRVDEIINPSSEKYKTKVTITNPEAQISPNVTQKEIDDLLLGEDPDALEENTPDVPTAPQVIDQVDEEGNVVGQAYYEPESDGKDAYVEPITAERTLEDIIKSRKPVKAETAEDVAVAGVRAATSPLNDMPEPTDAQKQAGNYKKAHINVQGLDITLENPRGSTRSGVDTDGEAWSVTMQHDYGYIKGTEGKDGDHIDVFVGQNPQSGSVFVVDTKDPKTGKFDEHKAFIGFDTQDEAEAAFAKAYPGQAVKRFMGATEMDMSQFKNWARSGKKIKPLSRQPAEVKTEPVLQVGVPNADIQNLQPTTSVPQSPPSQSSTKAIIEGEQISRNVMGETVSGITHPTIIHPESLAQKKKKPLPKQPMDLLAFLARNGGIQNESGELSTIGLKAFIPFHGRLIRADGKQLDYAREAAREAGYGEFETVRDFLDALSEAARGRKIYTLKDQSIVADKEQAKKAQQQTSKIAPEDQKVIDDAVALGIEVEGRSIEDILADVHEREGIQAEGSSSEYMMDVYADENDNYFADEVPEFFEKIEEAGLTVDQGVESSYETDDTTEDRENEEEVSVDGELLQGREQSTGEPRESQEDDTGGTSYTDARAEGSPIREIKTEQTAIGEQSIIPGAEKASDKDMAQRGADKPLKAKVPQKGMTGETNLFDQSENQQQDIFDTSPSKQSSSLSNAQESDKPMEQTLGASAKPMELVKRGDYYELYGDIAEKAADILNLVTATRNGQKELGIPSHRVEEYIDVLAQHGISVAMPSASEDMKHGTYTTAIHTSFLPKLEKGEFSAEEVKALFERALNSKNLLLNEIGKLTKDEIAKKYRVSFYGRNETKERMVKQAFENILSDFYYGESFSWSPMQETLQNAYSRLINAQTDADIAESVERRGKQVEAIKERREATKKALTNPETIDEFRTFVRENGIDKLTDEQLATYDKLVVGDTLEKRKVEKAKAAVVKGVETTPENLGLEIVETKHTQKGHNLFVVQLGERVEKEVYNTLNTTAKRLGGYYSSYRAGGAVPGFQFTTREAAASFRAAAKGEDVVSQKGSKPETRAERLRTQGQKMINDGNGALERDRKANTERRARMAAGAEASAAADIAMGKTLIAVADKLESGEPTALEMASTRADIITLSGIMRQAMIKSDSAKKNLSHDEREKLRQRKFEAADTRNIEYPYPRFYIENVAGVVKDIGSRPGFKMLAQHLEKLTAKAKKEGATVIKVRDPKYIAKVKEAAEEFENYTLGWIAEDGVQDYMRLQRMGITNLPLLREAVREYANLKSDTPKANPIKEAERKLIGKKWEGYFPTPPALAERMAEELDLKKEHRVLEPSAGKGSLIEAAIAVGADVNQIDAIEPISDLQDVLKLKGFKVVGRNFLDHDEKYDRIIMNPPFENGQDIDHVRHAYNLLEPGGKIIAIMSEGPFFRGDKKAAEFREWLDSVGTSEKLPEGSFKDSDRSTGVATRLVTITKPSKGDAPVLFQKTSKINKEEGFIVDQKNYYQYKATPEFLSQKTEIIKKLISLSEKMFGNSLNLRFVEAMKDMDNEETFGAYTTEEQIDGSIAPIAAISLAATNEKITWTLGHEGIHFLKSIGAFSKPVWELLENRAKTKWIKKFRINQRYRKEFENTVLPSGRKLTAREVEQKIIEEAIAEALGKNVHTREEKGTIQRAFQRVIQFLQDFGNWLKGKGFTSAESILSDIYKGDYRIDVEGDIQDTSAYQRGSNVNTSQFKRWFKGSKVVDENGEPLIVYHGTHADVKVFGEIFDYEFNRGGFFFTSNTKVAETYTTGAIGGESAEAPNIIPVYLSLKNPLIIDAKGRDYRNADGSGGDINYLVPFAENKGHDGLIVKNVIDTLHIKESSVPSDVYVALKPNQIKSVFNKGPFSDDNAHISFQRKDKQSDKFGKNKRKDSKTTRTKTQEDAIGTPFDYPDASIAETFYSKNKSIFDSQNLKAALKGSASKFNRTIADKMAGFKEVQNKIEEATGEKLSESEQVYLIEELYSSRVGARLDKLQNNEMSKVVSLLAKIEEKSKLENAESGKAVDKVEAYMMALHAPERNKEIAKINPKFADGGGSGMTDAEAAAIKKEVESKEYAADIKAAAAVIRKMLDESWDRMYSAGLINKTTYMTIKDKYKNYYPLRGFEEVIGGGENETGIHRGKGYDVRGGEFRQAFGRKSRAANLISHSFAIAEQSIVRSEKNRVAISLLNLALKTPNKKIWAVNEVEMKPRLNVKTGVVEYTPVIVSDKYQPDDTVVFAKRGGKAYRIHIKDERLGKAIRNMDMDQAGGFINIMAKGSRWFASVNTRWNPQFVVKNAFRDAISAAVNLQQYEIEGLSRKVMKNYFKAMSGIWGGVHGKMDTEWQKHYDEFILAGGKVAFNDIQSIKDRQARLFKEIKLMQSGSLNATKRGTTAMIRWVADMNDVVENALRLSTYVAARQSGVSVNKAASMAKNVTVNFNRRGEWGYTLNALYPFFNAGVQSTAIIMKALKVKKVQRVVISLALMGFIMDMVNAMVSPEDDDEELIYDKIPEWEKEANIIMMLPKGEIADAAKKYLPVNRYKGAEYIKIPKPYGYRVFGNMGRITSSVGRGSMTGSDAAINMGRSFATSFSPIDGGQSLLGFLSPTVLDPVVEVSQNKDWLGNEIVPGGDFRSAFPQSQKANYTTSGLSKAISESLNAITGGDEVTPGSIDVSPAVLDYYYSFLTGGMGRFIKDTAKVVNRVGMKAVGKELPEEEKLNIKDIPVVRDVIGATSDYRDKQKAKDRIQEYYDIRARLKRYLEDGDIDGAKAYKEKNKHILRVRSGNQVVDMLEIAKGMKALLKKTGETKMVIRSNKSLSEAEKTKLINEQFEIERKAVDKFNRLYNRATGITADNTRSYSDN